MRNRLIGMMVVAAAVAVMTPVAGSAQRFTLGPTLAYENDIDFGIGLEFGGDLPSLGEEFGFSLEFLKFFPDGPVDYFELNGNLTYDFPLEESTILPFVLAGLNLARASVDAFGVSSSATELGLNLGGGIKFNAGDFRPKAGVRFEAGGGEAFIIFVTLPFGVG